MVKSSVVKTEEGRQRAAWLRHCIEQNWTPESAAQASYEPPADCSPYALFRQGLSWTVEVR